MNQYNVFTNARMTEFESDSSVETILRDVYEDHIESLECVGFDTFQVTIKPEDFTGLYKVTVAYR
jgi:hypothetical protein